MKNRNSKSNKNKEFQHKPTISGTRPTAKNLPTLKLWDTNLSMEQKNEKSSEPSKHVSMMFHWDLYAKLVKHSSNLEITIAEVTIKALNEYLLKSIQSNEIKKLKERTKQLEKERSRGEHEFDVLEKTIKRDFQHDPKN